MPNKEIVEFLVWNGIVRSAGLLAYWMLLIGNELAKSQPIWYHLGKSWMKRTHFAVSRWYSTKMWCIFNTGLVVDGGRRGRLTAHKIGADKAQE
jgi:hypothetical protein